MDYTIFGCKTNRYFAEKWLTHPYLQGKNGYFIASCVVTDKAKSKWIKKALQQLPHLHNDEKLYLSGCGNIRHGVIDPQFYAVYHELAPYRDRIEILPEDPADFQMTDEERRITLQSKIRSLVPSPGKNLFTRKHLVVQTGCDNFCTFCLTVRARGRHKWRPIEAIVEDVEHFVEQGGHEVVLTGINLGAWGASSSNNFRESRLVELVETILDKTTISRIRISSLGVEFFDDRLIRLFCKNRVNAYVHLSIQSGSSAILAHMNRHYDSLDVDRALRSLRSLEREDGVAINIGADLIVGFPGETDADYAMTRDLVTKYQITQLHAFPFSAHVDHYSVPAGDFADQIPNHIIQKRLKNLLSAGEASYRDFSQKNDGKTLTLLIEKYAEKGGILYFSGWTENYLVGNEANFTPFSGQNIVRGALISGIYHHQG